MHVDQNAGVVEKLPECIAQGIILDSTALARFFSPNTTGIINVIGWIAKAEICLHAPEYLFVIGHHRAVTAQQPVIAKDPQIALTRRRIAWRFRDHDRRDAGTTAILAVPLRHECQQLVQLAIGEADQRQVEIFGQQVVQFGRQQRLVPGS